MDDSSSDNRGLIGTVLKAGELLRQFSSRPVWSTRNLAETTGFSRPTTYRLMLTLAEIGLVRRTSSGDWTLGAELIRLGAMAATGAGMRERVRPFLSGLVREPGDSAYLFVPQDGRMLCIDRTLVASAVKLTLVEVGASVRRRGSTSRVAAAFGAIDADGFDAAELAQVRNQGYSLNLEELAPGVCAISAPLLSASGDVEGVICLGGLRDRFVGPALQSHITKITAAADELSRMLGYAEERFPPVPPEVIRRETSR